MSEAVVKAFVYACGFLGTGITFFKFVKAVPIKLRETLPQHEHGKDLVVAIPQTSETTTAYTYLWSKLQETGLQLQEHVTETMKYIYIGISTDMALRLADELQLKRQTISGDWKIYSLNDAVEFSTTFSSGERIHLIQHVLDTLSVTGEEKDTGLFLPDDRLIHKAIQTKLIRPPFPLHEDKERGVLMTTWVKAIGTQPIDTIRTYYGDQVGFYFAFLGFYTQWLIGPSIVGTLVFIYQQLYGSTNMITACYALGITIWATTFLEFWKRKESEHAWRWGVLELEDIEHERPGFEGVREYDDIEERYVTRFSNIAQAKRYAFTIPILLSTLIGVIIVTFVCFRCDAWANSYFTEENGWNGMFQLLSMIPTIGYSVLVMIMDIYFLELAVSLNKYENHRTESEYANALVIKLASFYFINNFGLLFYIAFFVQDFELLEETLSSLLITRQFIGNIKETIIPYVLSNTSALKKQEKPTSKLEEEEPLAVYEGTFDDCLELFVQFGQVTLFAAAYPLAALCSLANNVIEIRSDGFKICTAHQRPLPVQCKGIGTWLHAFEILGYIAVLTNCTLIGLNSGQLEKLFPTITPVLTIACIVAAEHAMIILKLVVEMVVPDVPSYILDEQKRRRVQLRKQDQLHRASNDTVDRAHAIEFGASTAVTTQKVDELQELSVSKSPEQWLQWIQEEQSRRVQLEKEVQRLSDLYMQWVHDEQKRRKKLEAQVQSMRHEGKKSL